MTPDLSRRVRLSGVGRSSHGTSRSTIHLDSRGAGAPVRNSYAFILLRASLDKTGESGTSASPCWITNATPSTPRATDVPAQVRVLDGVDLSIEHTLEAGLGLDLLQSSVEMSHDGSRIAYVGRNREVEITALDTGRTVTIPDSLAWMASLAFSADNRLLAGGGVAWLGTASITVWNADTGHVVQILEGHGRPVPTNDQGISATLGTAVAFDPVSGDLLSGGFDGTVRKWDLQTGRSTVLHAFDFEVASVAVSYDGSLIAASDFTGEIVILDTRTGEVRRPERVSGRTFLAFSPDDTLLAGAGPDPVTNLWDVATGRIVRRFHGAIYPARDVTFLQGGSVLHVASGEGVQRRYLLDPTSLLVLARDLVDRSMTEDECRRYLDRACSS